MMKNKLITILGPTATGKTSVATLLAKNIDGEIISADSRQVYRSMDIGTGKDLGDYTVGGVNIPYHLIDIVDAGYKYNLYEYKRDFEAAYKDICSRKKQAILCGGTGLYIESVLKGYNLMAVPVNEALREELDGRTLVELTDILASVPGHNMHNKTDVDTVKRAVRAIEIAKYQASEGGGEAAGVGGFAQDDILIFGIDISRDLRRERISKRLMARIDEGMIEEVRGIMESGVKAEDLIYYGLEYKFITQHIIGDLTFEEMYRGLEVAIHQFAKRQMTWFRGMEKRGFEINWINGEQNIEERVGEIMRILAK